MELDFSQVNINTSPNECLCLPVTSRYRRKTLIAYKFAFVLKEKHNVRVVYGTSVCFSKEAPKSEQLAVIWLYFNLFTLPLGMPFTVKLS